MIRSEIIRPIFLKPDSGGNEVWMNGESARQPGERDNISSVSALWYSSYSTQVPAAKVTTSEFLQAASWIILNIQRQPWSISSKPPKNTASQNVNVTEMVMN